MTLARSSLGSSCTASRSSPSVASAARSAVTSAALELSRRRTASQQHGVAGLQRQPERVDGDIRPALVDDSDHAERDPLLAQLQPVGQRAPTQHLADRVGQAGDLAQPVGDAVDTRCGFSASLSSMASGVPAWRGCVQILLVGGKNLVACA